MGTIVTPRSIRRSLAVAFACLAVSAQYASAQNPALTVVSHQRFADSAGNVVVIGEVRNDTNSTLAIPRAMVSLNGGTPQNVEVMSSSARKLSGSIFTYALAPKQLGFFRYTANVANATISSHSVTADAQLLFTAQPMKTSLEVIVSLNGLAYSLRVRNQGEAAIAYNFHSGVAGYLNNVLQDVDLTSAAGAICSTPTVVPGGSSITISGSFDRPVSSINLVALKWDETYVEPSAFTAPAAGGVGDIRVASECAWTAQSNVSWITITSGASGTGDGFVRISAPPNPTTASRTGTLTVAGLTVRVEQAAGTGTTFTDPTLSSGVTPVRTQHISELRTRVQALRSRFGLTTYSFTDPTLSAGTTPIRAVHLTQLRQALAEAYVAAGRAAPMYSESTVAAGMTIKASHITELRAAVLAIE